MKIDLFLNHKIGKKVLEETPAGHISKVVACNNEIFESSVKKGIPTFRSHNELKTVSNIGFSIHYNKIFKKDFIERYSKLYNIHPGFLPWGKGRHPCFWALWHNEPAGATLHEIDEGLDTGPIVLQELVSKEGVKNGYELFNLVEQAEFRIYRQALDSLLNGKEVKSRPQLLGGSSHREREIYTLKKREFWSRLSDSEKMRLYHCLDFPGYVNLEGWKDDRTI